MSKFAVRELTHDHALDVLFQQSAEEQFEALRAIQDQPERGVTMLEAFKQWFRSDKASQNEPYDDFFHLEAN